MGALLTEHAGWMLLSAALGAVITWALLVRKVTVREIVSFRRWTPPPAPGFVSAPAAGRHRADTAESPLDASEPLPIGAHARRG